MNKLYFNIKKKLGLYKHLYILNKEIGDITLDIYDILDVEYIDKENLKIYYGKHSDIKNIILKNEFKKHNNIKHEYGISWFGPDKTKDTFYTTNFKKAQEILTKENLRLTEKEKTYKNKSLVNFNAVPEHIVIKSRLNDEELVEHLLKIEKAKETAPNLEVETKVQLNFMINNKTTEVDQKFLEKFKKMTLGKNY